MKSSNIRVMLIPALCTLLWHYGLTQLFSALPHCTAAPSELEPHWPLFHGLAALTPLPWEGLERSRAACVLWSLRVGLCPVFKRDIGKKAILGGKLCCGVMATGIFHHFLGKSYDRGSRRLVTVQETQMHSQP